MLLVLFWRDRWIQGSTMWVIAPTLTSLVPTHTQNHRTVKQGLTNHKWFSDASGEILDEAAGECVRLWLAVLGVQRNSEGIDNFSWSWISSGVFLVRSFYTALM